MRSLFIVALAAAPAILAQQGPLECGAVVSGAFVQGAVETHTLTAQAGDSILIRAAISAATLDDTGFAVKFTVLDSANRLVNPRTVGVPQIGGSVVGEYDLPLSGPYVIRAQSSNLQLAGSYRLSFTFLNRSCNSGNLACGLSLSDSFSQALQIKTYQFPATAGDVLTFNVVKSAPFTLNSSLLAVVYSASGKVLLTDGNQAVSIQIGSSGTGSVEFTAKETGPLTIVMFDRGVDALFNSYTMTMARVNGPCGGGSGGSTVLTCGSVLQGNLRTPLAIDRYTVELQAGDVVALQTGGVEERGALRPIAEIYDPLGRLIPAAVAIFPSSRALASFTFTAKVSGTHTMLVRDSGAASNTGSYAVAMVRLNRPCGTSTQLVTCGSLIDGSLKGLLATNAYMLTASRGDTFQLRLLHTDQNATFKPRVDIYDSGANVVQSVTAGEIGSVNFTVPADGVYALLAVDSYDYSQSGNYTFSLQRLNRPCSATPLSCGMPVAANFTKPLASAMFTYDSPPGQSFTVRMQDTTGALQPVLEVYDANGNSAGRPVLTSGAGVDVVQGAGGPYTIVATDRSVHPVGGPFNVELLRTTNACTATPAKAQTLRGLITGQAPYQVYSLPVRAGDALLVRSASLTGGFSAQMELYDPSGVRVDSQTFGFSPRAVEDGSYTVIVGPSAPRTGGAYAFSWQILNDPAGAEPLNCGGSVSASLTAANQFRYYSATADAGDLLRLIFTRTSDNFAPQIELFDPTGARLAGNSDISQRALAGGSYLVVVSPSTSNGETGSFVVAFQRPNHPCRATSLACGSTTLRQVAVPGQLDAFGFTGTPGNQANIRLSQRTGNYVPFVELYDASGVRVGSSGSGALLATLPANGPYSLLVRDRQGVALGSYRVNVQDNTKACVVDDKEPPTVTLVQPTGGEVIAGASALRIQWESDDNVGVTSHQLALSTDGGKTFSTVISPNVGGVAQSFLWSVPPGIAPSRNAILSVTATDSAGNTQTAVSGPLSIIGSGFTPTSTTTFSYDPLNRVTAAFGDGRSVQYVWDAAGNLVQIVIGQ